MEEHLGDKRRWKVSIRMCVIETGCEAVDCVKVAQGRVQRRTFVIAVLNSRVKRISLAEYEQRKEEPVLQSKLNTVLLILYFACMVVRHGLLSYSVAYYRVCHFLLHRN